MVDIRIVLYNRLKSMAGEEMHFCIWYLRFQTPNNGCGEHNITNGRKPYDEKLCQVEIG